MKRRKKRDGHSNVFIVKLEKEMKQTQIVIYREFSKNQEEGKEQPELMDLFERLNLQALC